MSGRDTREMVRFSDVEWRDLSVTKGDGFSTKLAISQNSVKTHRWSVLKMAINSERALDSGES